MAMRGRQIAPAPTARLMVALFPATFALEDGPTDEVPPGCLNYCRW
jgi:hypothetical protein